MREYAKLSPTFWTGETGSGLRERGPEAILVACYLISCPLSNMLGLYALPRLYISTETGLGNEGACKGLASCIETGFCRYDEKTQTVWVVEMASWQIARELKPNDNRCIGIQREYMALPKSPFLGAFFDHYQSRFHLTESRGRQAPPKALPSHEHEQEQEQEQTSPSSTSSEADPQLFPGGKETKQAAKEKRFKEITLDAIQTFNASALTKPEGSLSKVSTSVGLDNRTKQIKRIAKLASQIASETSDPPSPQITREFWEDYWAEVAKDDFMSGRARPGEEHKNWKPDFEYLTREKTMLKVFDRASEES